MRASLLFVFSLGLAFVAGDSAAQPREVQIGVVVDGPGVLNRAVLEFTHQAILELTEGEFDIRISPEHTLVAEWSLESVGRALDEMLTRDEIDVVLAMGVLASHEVATRGALNKPVVAPFILNFGLDRVPFSDGASGVRNLSYLVLPRTLGRDIEMFRSIVEFEKVAVLFNQSMMTGLPYLRANVEADFTRAGIPFQSILVGDDVSAAVASIEAEVDAVFVMPMVHLSPVEMEQLVDELIGRRLPSFSILGRPDVEIGVLAALNPDIFPRLTRRIALNVQRILLGDPAESLPVAFAAGEKLSINIETAQRIGLPIPWEILTEAELVGEESLEGSRALDITSVVAEAVAANRELAAAREALRASREDVAIARAARRPRFDLDAVGLQIDEDRASSSFGNAPETSFRGTVQFSQLLYSEKAWANVAIQNEFHASREAELRSAQLDIAQAAATAYLQVLRAKSFENIQKENLQLTRSNLELAQVREMVGESGPAEALRLESQLAANIADAIAANAQRNVAEIRLNQIRHRPLEEQFHTAETRLGDVLAHLDADRVSHYFDSKQTFAAFRDFLSGEALERSPELAAIDRAIAAQQRALRSADRALWRPELALQGEVSQLFDESGAGTRASANLPSGRDDTDWSVALGLTFPLFEGGAKWASRRQFGADLARLRHEREGIAERIEQRMRVALHLSGATFAAIEQSRRARTAARASLDLVVGAYSQGTVTILDLLDAQSRALIADEQEAAAIYDFYIDLIEVYRALGTVEPMLDATKRREMLSRADAYLVEKGIAPRPSP